jgi:hypothetical protein
MLAIHALLSSPGRRTRLVTHAQRSVVHRISWRRRQRFALGRACVDSMFLLV